MASNMNFAPTAEPTINDIEQTLQNGLEALRNAPLNEQITAALKFLTPSGYRPIAQLEEDGRKKRSNAAASNWNPETGEIVIYFERQAPESNLSVVENQPTIPASIEDDLSAKRQEFFAKKERERKAGLIENTTELPPVERIAASRNTVLSILAEPKVSDEEIQQLCIALAEAEKAGKAFIALKWFRDNELTAHGYAWAESLAYRQAVVAKAFDVGAIMTTQIPNPKAPQHPTTTVKLNRESKYAQAVAPRFQPIQLRGEGPSASELLLRDRERF
jgi:hypothetical protein